MLNRRLLLQATGALVVTFVVRPSLDQSLSHESSKTVSPDEVEGFLAISPDRKVAAYSGKVDLGTGLRTALTQIVAEELDEPISDVELIEGDTALTPDQGPTYGSLSVQNGGMQLRRAAATARQALLREAAARLNVDVSALTIREGFVTAGHRQQIPFGQLVAGDRLAVKVDANAREKAPSDYTVGRQVPCAARHSGKSRWTLRFHAGFQTAWHAARPCDPALRDRSDAHLV
jgi:nicotinate dehydrogenase subunit B